MTSRATSPSLALVSDRNSRSGSLDLVKHSLWVRLALALVVSFVALPTEWAKYWGGRTEGEWSSVVVVAVVWAAAALLSYRRLLSSEGSQSALSGGMLVLDVAAMTILLSMSGCAQNPFTMLYFVPLGWAILVAPRLMPYLALATVLAFALLLGLTAQTLGPHQNHPAHAHFFHHVVGMAIALAVAGAFMTYLVQRIGRLLHVHQVALLALEEERKRNQLTVALGAMAAGAAHELGTPLATIQILAEELNSLTGEGQHEAQSTIVAEVQRMKSILHGLGSSQLSAEHLRLDSGWTLAELKEQLPSGVTFRVSAKQETTQPRLILSQMLRELVSNALSVTQPERVFVEVGVEGQWLFVRVSDQGPGVSEEELRSLVEPFVSYRGGTGLGLFLVRVHAQQLGGELVLSSGQGLGFEALLRLPVEPRIKI